MSKLPAFQFYPGDWRKDPGVQSLSFHDRGVWFELICLMHESEVRGKLLLNGLPMPEDAICRLLGLDNQILTTTLTTLLTYGVASKCEITGAIMSRRMVRDEEIRQVRKSCGKMGGNPNLVNQKPTTVVKVDPTPSSSSSTSVSKKNKQPRKIFVEPSLLEIKEYAKQKNLTLDCEYWLDYWTQRGWKYKGGESMKDWQAAMRTWEKNQEQFKPKGSNHGTNKHQQFESSQQRNERLLKQYMGEIQAGSDKNSDHGFLYQLPASNA